MVELNEETAKAENLFKSGHFNSSKADRKERISENISNPEKETNAISYISTFIKVTPIEKENASIILFINIDKQHCAGEELRASLKLINNTFKNSHVTFILADFLQRFTHQIYGASDQEAETLSIKNGLNWRAEHEQLIEKELTNITFSFIHWKELTQDEISFRQYREMIEAKYSSDAEFKRKFDKTAMEFLSAQLGDKSMGDKSIKYVDIARGFTLCLDYLKEECAVEIVLADKKIYSKKIDYEIYPESPNDALSITHDAFIPAGTLTYLSVKNKLAASKRLLANHKHTLFRDSNLNSKTNLRGRSQENVLPPDNALSLAYFRSVKIVLSEENIDPTSRIELVKKIVVDAERILLQANSTSPNEVKYGLVRS